MPSLSYENFDLLIIPIDDGYQARVINSPVGQATTMFKLPFRPEQLRLNSSQHGRSLRQWVLVEGETQHSLDPQSFGELLYRAVFVEAVGELLLRSYDSAYVKDKGLRIRLRLDNEAAELAILPWEFLYVPSWQRFLAISDRTPLVRYLEVSQPERPFPASLPLRILVVVSNPTDVEKLEVEQEWARLQAALKELQERNLILLERLPAATLNVLQDRLREVDVHILHFIGHGAFDPNANKGVLIFENEDGRAQEASALQLATLVHDHESLRLVFLNACEGARSGSNDSFAGVAQMLIQQGVPAVLAMQFEVSDPAALALAHEFYQAIADRYPVDAAVSEARKRIYVAGDEQEWGTPVIYMRAPDGYIFQEQQLSAKDEATAAPTWHALGTLWLAIGLAGSILLIGLGYFLLSGWPMLQGTLTAMGGVVAFLLGFLGLREERTLFPRITQSIGQSRLAQTGMGAMLAAGVLSWAIFGLPIVRCGPLECPPPGVRTFTIGEWENLTPGVSKFEPVWIKGTRQVLYDKLSAVDSLRGYARDELETGESISRYLTVRITGGFQKINRVELSASLINARDIFEDRVTVSSTIDEESENVESQILALQNQLAEAILAKLGIRVSSETLEMIRKTPTDNGHAQVLNNNGAFLVEQGEDLNEAEGMLRAAIILDPMYAGPQNNLGILLQKRNELEAAVVAHQRAIELAPNNPLYHFNLGLASERLGNYAAAIEAYARAIELDPAYVKAYNNLGFTYLLMGELDNAEKELQRGLEFSPENPNLHKNLGRVYLKQERAQEAIEELQLAIALFSQGVYVEAYYYLALAYQELGQVDNACTALDEYNQFAPTSSEEFAAAQELQTELQCP